MLSTSEPWALGISTGIAYHRPILTLLEPIRAAGFKYLEICTYPAHLEVRDKELVKRVKSQIQACDLIAYSLHTPFGHDLDITDPSDHHRVKSVDHVKRAVEAAAMLEAKVFVAHPGSEDHGWVWEREQRLELSIKSLREIQRACQDLGLTLAVETALPHLLGGQPADLKRIVDALDTDPMGVCLDTSHTSLGGYLRTSLDLFAAQLIHVHASDNFGHADDHLPPGKGRIEWVNFIYDLKNVGYRRVLVLEINGGDDIAAALQEAEESQPRVRYP